MAKFRIARTEIEYKIQKYKAEGEKIISDRKEKNKRIVVMTNVVLIFTSNGWLTIEPR